MDFQSLVDQKFSESEFYEILLFEIEENFEQYFSKHIHFYFDRTEDKKIKITDVVYFADEDSFYKTRRKIIEKKEWYEICEDHTHVDLMLVRLDRTGKYSVNYGDRTRHQDVTRLGWLDEIPDRGPLTPEEIRQGLLELMGVFDTHQELERLRTKKAV